MYWIVRAVGWENVPRRAWHIVKGRLGLDSSDRLKHELDRRPPRRERSSTITSRP